MFFFHLTTRQVKNFKKLILDLIFPIACVKCKKEGEIFCDNCADKIEIFNKPYCPVCRFRLANSPNGESDLSIGKIIIQHKNCQRKSNLKKLIAAASHNEPLIKELIEIYKYQFVSILAKPLASLIIKSIGNLAEKNKYMIVSVPLHRKRLQWRSFNQAELLAKNLSNYFNIELSDILTRTKETVPQVKLNFEERALNIKDAFSINSEINLKGKIVLLVDDVYTSGATMNECAGLLKEAGAKEVWGCVVAM